MNKQTLTGDPPHWVTEVVGCNCEQCRPANEQLVELILEDGTTLVPYDHVLVEDDGTEHVFEPDHIKKKRVRCHAFGEYNITVLLSPQAVNDMVIDGVLDVEEK